MEEEDPVPANRDPPVFSQYYSLTTEYLAQYGWLVLVIIVVLYYLWRRMTPTIDSLRFSSQVPVHKKYDSSEIERRQLAMDAHRIKLQEEHDKKAAEHAVRRAELEARKRQEKLDDWERHQAGQGYRSKVKKSDDSPEPATVIPKSKKKLRDSGYNPLMSEDPGESSGTWRYNRRGPSSGGGG